MKSVNKKSVKKFILIALAAVMGTSAFTACSNSGSIQPTVLQPESSMSQPDYSTITEESVESSEESHEGLESVESVASVESTESTESVESIDNIEVAKKLLEKYDVDMPIVNSAFDVLYNNLSVQDAIKNLMTRSLKFEND